MVMLFNTIWIGERGLQGRAKLRRIWMSVRIGLIFTGINFLVYSAMVLVTSGGIRDPHRRDPAGVNRIMIGGFNFLLWGMLPTHAVRCQVSRLLGRIGSSTNELQQAASIGALLGRQKSIKT